MGGLTCVWVELDVGGPVLSQENIKTAIPTHLLYKLPLAQSLDVPQEFLALLDILVVVLFVFDDLNHPKLILRPGL
jgi:hypothetical protein